MTCLFTFLLSHFVRTTTQVLHYPACFSLSSTLSTYPLPASPFSRLTLVGIEKKKTEKKELTLFACLVYPPSRLMHTIMSSITSLIPALGFSFLLSFVLITSFPTLAGIVIDLDSILLFFIMCIHPCVNEHSSRTFVEP